jgi:hypothetical protein
MSTEKNLPDDNEQKIEKQLDQSPKNVFLQAWNGFVKEINDGLVNLKQTMEESSKKNQENWEYNKQNIDTFFKSLGESWQKDLNSWSSEVEKFQLENKEEWEKNKEKITNFFHDSQAKWDAQLKTWNQEIQKKQKESSEQWEARKEKINQDLREWRDQTKKDWEKGLKRWQKEMIKGSYMFLLFMVPILIVLFVIVWLITWLLPPR